jgi:hypothetical protein
MQKRLTFYHNGANRDELRHSPAIYAWQKKQRVQVVARLREDPANIKYGHPQVLLGTDLICAGMLQGSILKFGLDDGPT